MDSEDKLKRTKFFVEATSFEKFNLWKQHHDKVEWIDDNIGFYQIVGYIKSLPVSVEFSFCKINETYVCFYYPTSRMVDWNLVENYIEKNYPVRYDNDSRRAMTNAMNFHHCLGFCRNEY